MRQTLEKRVVQRACDKLGGPEALAERLGLSAPTVRVWLTGTRLPPPRIFFRIVDLLQEEPRLDPKPAAKPDDYAAGG